MILIRKTSEEKKEYVRKLLHAGIPYREIQDHLKFRFSSGMSNTTLKKMAGETDEILNLRKDLTETKKELELYKELYFELLKTIKEKL